MKHNFAFSGTTGFKGKCPDPYVREEVLEARFVEVLGGIALSENVMNWIREALFDSYVDEKRFHDEAVSRLKAEHTRYQNTRCTLTSSTGK